MPLELCNRSYRGVNPQTPKRKNGKRFVARFCVAADYDQLEKYLLRKLSRRKTKHCSLQWPGVDIFG